MKVPFRDLLGYFQKNQAIDGDIEVKLPFRETYGLGVPEIRCRIELLNLRLRRISRLTHRFVSGQRVSVLCIESTEFDFAIWLRTMEFKMNMLRLPFLIRIDKIPGCNHQRSIWSPTDQHIRRGICDPFLS